MTAASALVENNEPSSAGGVVHDNSINHEDATTSSDVSNRQQHNWLGGESNLLDEKVEERGVQDILAALTDEERKEMKDLTMPIRHFRAEKVSSGTVRVCMPKRTA
jgi:hypothetical protein